MDNGEEIGRIMGKELDRRREMGTDVKSPVASLCLVCSSVRNRVRVTMLRLIFSWAMGGISPLVPLTAVVMMVVYGGNVCNDQCLKMSLFKLYRYTPDYDRSSNTRELWMGRYEVGQRRQDGVERQRILAGDGESREEHCAISSQEIPRSNVHRVYWYK